MPEDRHHSLAPAQRRVRAALWCAGLCILGLAATWGIAAHLPAARLRDAAALRGFIGLDHPIVTALANDVLSLVSPMSATVFALVAMAVAVRRGRSRLAVAIPVVLGGAVGSAELLKPLLAVPHDYIDATHQLSAASWPSGHSTAVMSMTLCALLVAPSRWRPAVAAIGGVFTVAVGFSLLTLAWHMPSDVIGGYLMAGVWVSAAVAVLSRAEAAEPADAARPEPSARPRRAPLQRREWRARQPSLLGGEALVPGVVIGSVLGAALVIVAMRPHQVAGFADTHHSFVAVATVIAALATTLVSGFTVGLRR